VLKMITRVKLKNWRSHLESELEFTKGTNVLVGILGSGKSSIMNAICFGLFGTFPDIQSRKIKLDDIIMNKPFVKNESQITVDFTINGKNYSIMRVIEREKGTTYSEIREQNNLLDAPNTQRVTELVEKILKIDYELFSRAIYSEQNSLDYFLRLPKGERMRRIDNLLMIDKFEKTRSSAVALKNKIVDIKKGKQSVVDQINIEDLKKSLNDANYSLENLDKTKSSLSTELNQKKKSKEKIENETSRLEKIEKNLVSLNAEKESIVGAEKENEEFLKEIEKFIKDKKIHKINDASILEKMTQKLEKDLLEKKSNYEYLTKNISGSEARIEFLKKEIGILNKELEEKSKSKAEAINIEREFGKPQNVLDNQKKELEKIKEKIVMFSSKIEQTNESLEKIIHVKNKCPVCESKITDEKRGELTKEYQKRIKFFKTNLDKFRKERNTRVKKTSELENIVERYKKYSEKISGLDEIRNKFNESKNNLSGSQTQLIKNKEQSLKLKNQISNLEKEIEKHKQEKLEIEKIIEKNSELEDRKARLLEIQQSKKKIQEKLEKTQEKLKGKDLNKIRKEFREIVSRYSELSARIESLDELISERIQRRDEIKNKLKTTEKESQEISRLEKIIRDLNVFENALQKTQVELRKTFIEAVNNTMENIFPNIYPYNDFKNIRLYIKEKDYVLQLQDRSERWIDVDGVASGGERSISCLALRIAFSLVLAPQLKWLVLDEPTHNLDLKSVEDLAETLKTRISEFSDQIFLITHDKKLENAVTGQLYKFSRNKETDDFTKIEVVN